MGSGRAVLGVAGPGATAADAGPGAGRDPGRRQRRSLPPQPRPLRSPGPPPGFPVGPPSGFPPPPVQATGRGPGRALVVGVVAVVGAIALIAGASFVFLGSDSGPDYPDRWDARVAPIADWVEDERDLAFAHPVYVDFLTPAQYRAAATSTSEDVTPEDRRMLDQFVGAYRAIGLAEGKVDLNDSMNEVSDSGTLAFYDPEDERVRVRGTELTPGLEVTLAHELTHALQDQHFDLTQIYDDTSDLQPDSYDTQLRAVVEGDATRIEERYVEDELTLKERQAYEEDQVDEGEAASEELEKESVPPGLLGAFAAPYWFGPRFVSLLEQERGSKAVDEAISLPPSSSEQMFDPLTYLDGDRAVTVDPVDGAGPAPPCIEQGPFGSVQWFLMLAERIKPAVALRAVDGWGGDSHAVWVSGGKTCVAGRFSGDTPEDDDEMYGALRRWTKAMPDGTASIDRESGSVSFESCDPGPEADLEVTGKSGDALAYPAVRTDIVISSLADGADPEDAGCFGTQVVSALSPSQLLGEDDYTESEEFLQVLATARDRCI